METTTGALRSFITSLIVGFILPITGVGMVLTVLNVGVYSPWSEFSQARLLQVFDVLLVFGSGNWLQGILIIAITISLMGGLFDLFALCQYRMFR